jgi:pyruvate kinase
MHYEILATLGPASASDRVIKALRAAGATGFRLNTSHLSLEELRRWLKKLDPLLGDTDSTVPLTLDLQGSKWRLGRFNASTLRPGETVEIVLATAAQGIGRLPVPHPDFFYAVPMSSGRIMLDDARIQLAVQSMEADRVRARVVKGGEVVSRKGITFSRSAYRKESLNEKDRQIFEQTRQYNVRYAVSYVKDAQEMANYRSLLGDTVYLIAKLERESALREAAQIASSAHAVWLCRGDLGAEMGFRGMAAAVRTFSQQVNTLPVDVLLAGQVLQHMTHHPFPTRSEICCLYDALRAGYRGVVLSDETAVGRNPVDACRAAATFR